MLKQITNMILKKPSTFISDLDMNNLYGWAMSEYIPCGWLKWLKMLINLM